MDGNEVLSFAVIIFRVVLVLAAIFLLLIVLNKKPSQRSNRKVTGSAADARSKAELPADTATDSEIDRLYTLKLKEEELKNYLPYARLFDRQALALQILIGINREEYKDDKHFIDKLSKSFLSVFISENLREDGFHIETPLPVKPGKDAFLREKRTLSKERFQNELNAAEAAVNDFKLREKYKLIIEQIGKPLFSITNTVKSGTGTEKAADIKTSINEIITSLRSAGIYPLFYDDLKGDTQKQAEFTVGNPGSIDYPGFYVKNDNGYVMFNSHRGSQKEVGNK